MGCPKSRDITCTEGTGNGEHRSLAQRLPQQWVKLKFTAFPGGKFSGGRVQGASGTPGPHSLTERSPPRLTGSLFTFQAWQGC